MNRHFRGRGGFIGDQSMLIKINYSTFYKPLRRGEPFLQLNYGLVGSSNSTSGGSLSGAFPARLPGRCRLQASPSSEDVFFFNLVLCLLGVCNEMVGVLVELGPHWTTRFSISCFEVVQPRWIWIILCTKQNIETIDARNTDLS
jgi:hypothetical protein